MAKVVTLMLNPSVDVMLEFDTFEKTKTNRVINQIEHMGGKGLNVSLVARSFGLEVCATGFIGKDKKEELSQILANVQIENAFVTVEGKTRTNYKLMDKSEGAVTEANCKGFDVSYEKVAELEQVLDKTLSDADILVITGSLPQGIDAQFYAKCIEKANKRGIKTILDASGKALKLAISKKPYAIKPNIDELSEFVGKKLTTEQEVKTTMNELNQNGVTIVVASMGADGAMFSREKEIIKGKTFDIDFKSAVGAGDSMVAAMCYAIAENLTLKRMAQLCIAAGCVTTSKSATNLCKAEEVFINEERVETI